MPTHKTILRGMALGLAALIPISCGRRERADVAGPAVQTAESPGEPGVVECTGVLHPASRFILRANPGEELEKVNVAPGDEVQAGDVLAVLSCPALRAEWASAHEKILALRQEEAKLDAARWRKTIAEERRTEIRKRWEVEESLSQKIEGYDPQIHARELMEARQAVEQELEGLDREIALGTRLQPEIESLLQLQEQHLSWLGGRISNLVVRAPFPGVVVRVETPAPAVDGVWLEVHDRDRFTVQGLLWQNQLAGVETGCAVTIAPDFMSDTLWKGTVQSIGFAAVPEPMQSFPRFPVVIALDEGPDAGTLRDGMTVSMKIHLPTSPIAAP